MSLPLDEPSHAKILRQVYPPGCTWLLTPNPWGTRLGLGLVCLGAVLWMGWAWQQGGVSLGDLFGPPGVIPWGEFGGAWLQGYWFSQDGVAHLDLDNGWDFTGTIPLGVRWLYQLGAGLGIPWGLFNGGVVVGLTLAIVLCSFYCTLALLPIPLAGMLTSGLTLISLWSGSTPILPTPDTWGCLGIMVGFLALLDVPSGPLLKRRQGFATYPGLGLGLTVLGLGLFAPRYLWILLGLVIWQVLERLGLEPKKSKPQTVQQFLAQRPSPSQVSKRHQVIPIPRSSSATGKPRSRRWRLLVKSPRIVGLYLPLLVLMGVLGAITLADRWLLGLALGRAQAIHLPEFQGTGLWHYFHPNPGHFWIYGDGSGLVPLLWPPLLWAGVVLPFWLSPWGLRQLPLLREVRPQVRLLGKLVVVCLGCFILAHTFFLHLGWPQDYLRAGDRFALAVASGMVLAALVESLAQSFMEPPQRFGALVTTGLGTIVLVGLGFTAFQPPAPLFYAMSRSPIVVALETPAQAIHLATSATFDGLPEQDPPFLLASVHQLAIPQPTAETIVSPQIQIVPPSLGHALRPQHRHLYDQQRRDLQGLLRAEYTVSVPILEDFVDTQGINRWLLNRRYLTLDGWRDRPLAQMYPDLSRIILQELATGQPLLAQWSTSAQPHQVGHLTLKTLATDGDWVLLGIEGAKGS